MKDTQEYLKYIEHVAAIYASKESSVKARLTENDLRSLFAEILVKCSKQFKAKRGASFKTYLNTALKNAWKNALNDSVRQGGICLTDVVRPGGERGLIEDVLFREHEIAVLGHKFSNREFIEPDESPRSKAPSFKPKKSGAQSKDKLPARLEGMSAEQLKESLILSDLVHTFYDGGPQMRAKFPEVWNFLKGLKNFKCALCGQDFRGQPMGPGKLYAPDDSELRRLGEQWGKIPTDRAIFCLSCCLNIGIDAYEMNVDLYDWEV